MSLGIVVGRVRRRLVAGKSFADMCEARSLQAFIVAEWCRFVDEGIALITWARVGVGKELDRRATRPTARHLGAEQRSGHRWTRAVDTMGQLLVGCGYILEEAAIDHEAAIDPQVADASRLADLVRIAQHEFAWFDYLRIPLTGRIPDALD